MPLDLVLGKFIVDGVQHEWLPRSFAPAKDRVVIEISNALDLGKLATSFKVPDALSYEFANARLVTCQEFTATWDRDSFMDLCMRDHLSLLYELQKPIWLQFDDVMSRYCARLTSLESGEDSRAFFAPTFPIVPLGWTPNNQVDWENDLIVDNAFQNDGFVVHRPSGMVLFDEARPKEQSVSLGYTWRALVRISKCQLTPLDDKARYAYGGTVVFETVALTTEYGPWNVVLPCEPCADADCLGTDIDDDDDEGGGGGGGGGLCFCEVFGEYPGENPVIIEQDCDVIEKRFEHYAGEELSDLYYIVGWEISTFDGFLDTQCAEGEDTVIASARIRPMELTDAYYTAWKEKLNQPHVGGYATFGGPSDLWGIPFNAWGPPQARTGMYSDLRLEDPSESCGAQEAGNWRIEYIYDGHTIGTAPDSSFDLLWGPEGQNMNNCIDTTAIVDGQVRIELSGKITVVLVWVGTGSPPASVDILVTGRARCDTDQPLQLTAVADDGLGDPSILTPGYNEAISEGTHRYTVSIDGTGRGVREFTPSCSAYRDFLSSEYQDEPIACGSIFLAAEIGPCDRLPDITDAGLTIYAAQKCVEMDIPEELNGTDPISYAACVGEIECVHLTNTLDQIPDDAYVVGMKCEFDARTINLQPAPADHSVKIEGLTVGAVSSEVKTFTPTEEWTFYTLGGSTDTWGFEYTYLPTNRPVPLLRGLDIALLKTLFYKTPVVGEESQLRNVVWTIYYVPPCGSESDNRGVSDGGVGNGNCYETVTINDIEYQVRVPCGELLT